MIGAIFDMLEKLYVLLMTIALLLTSYMLAVKYIDEEITLMDKILDMIDRLKRGGKK